MPEVPQNRPKASPPAGTTGAGPHSPARSRRPARTRYAGSGSRARQERRRPAGNAYEHPGTTMTGRSFKRVDGVHQVPGRYFVRIDVRFAFVVAYPQVVFSLVDK